MPDGVTSIGSNTFISCTSLKSITIPASVKTIGLSAFYLCDNIVIYGKSGSAAQTYAKENDLKFVVR